MQYSSGTGLAFPEKRLLKRNGIYSCDKTFFFFSSSAFFFCKSDRTTPTCLSLIMNQLFICMEPLTTSTPSTEHSLNDCCFASNTTLTMAHTSAGRTYSVGFKRMPFFRWVWKAESVLRGKREEYALVMGSGLTRARKSGDRNKLKSQFLSENSSERSLTGIFGRSSVMGPLK